MFAPLRSILLWTLPNIQYVNHSGDQTAHLAGGSMGTGGNCGGLGEMAVGASESPSSIFL